jgi:tRNA U34 5-methylaminomethyl-2-thiouridine-forming methyltransferase MnmC
LENIQIAVLICVEIFSTFVHNMERHLVITADGSTTLLIPELNETYHSIHGAERESLHVFIDAGLKFLCGKGPAERQVPVIRILEMGFGTGLNALLTLLYAEEHQLQVYYEALEKYPLPEEEVALLNYRDRDKLLSLHACAWEKPVALSTGFMLHKRQLDLLNYTPEQRFDLVYFDAFAPGVQPKLWSREVFAKLYTAMSPGGVLVTYSSKGTVKNALREAGFEIKRLPGAAGKRHILRAVNNEQLIIDN